MAVLYQLLGRDVVRSFTAPSDYYLSAGCKGVRESMRIRVYFFIKGR